MLISETSLYANFAECPECELRLKRRSRKFAPTLDCWHYAYSLKATAHSLYERQEGE